MKRKFKEKKTRRKKGSTSARLKRWDTESAEPETAERLAIGDSPWTLVSYGTRTTVPTVYCTYTCSILVHFRQCQRLISCTVRILLLNYASFGLGLPLRKAKLNLGADLPHFLSLYFPLEVKIRIRGLYRNLRRQLKAEGKYCRCLALKNLEKTSSVRIITEFGFNVELSNICSLIGQVYIKLINILQTSDRTPFYLYTVSHKCAR